MYSQWADKLRGLCPQELSKLVGGLVQSIVMASLDI